MHAHLLLPLRILQVRHTTSYARFIVKSEWALEAVYAHKKQSITQRFAIKVYAGPTQINAMMPLAYP